MYFISFCWILDDDMPSKEVVRDIQKMQVQKQTVEMADAHCHLEFFPDTGPILAAVHYGVLTMVTNGVNLATSKRAMELSDGKNVFAAIGIDPENALKIGDDELDDRLEEMNDFIKQNIGRIVAIGEIGLDYTKAKSFEGMAKQRTVFEHMLETAKSLKLPVSVHSRESLQDIMDILEEKSMEQVHLHFFEGNAQQAKAAERRGYMISIPPIESGKRMHVIKEVSIDHLMSESDAPAVGETPIFVEKSVRMIAAAKGLPFEKTAETLTMNTKKFFNIHKKIGFMRG